MWGRPTMKINFEEAEFLARLFDATLTQTAKNKQNIPDFIAAQAFLGNDVNPGDAMSEEEMLQHFEGIEHDIICFRSRIKAEVGI
jgi:hypothetical protein